MLEAIDARGDRERYRGECQSPNAVRGTSDVKLKAKLWQRFSNNFYIVDVVSLVNGVKWWKEK